MRQLAFLECLDKDGRLLVQLFGTTAWSRHFGRIAELRVIDCVGPFLFCHDGNKTMAPEDLFRYVGCSRLGGDPSGFHYSFKYDDDFEVLGGQVIGRDIIKRTPLVNDVTDD